MRLAKRKTACGKFMLCAVPLVMSLVLALGSAQTTLAKNTPVPPPHLQGSGAIGTGEGGGGSIPIDEATLSYTTKTQGSVSVQRVRAQSDGNYGASLFGETLLDGYYYGVVCELFKINWIYGSRNLQYQTDETNYERE